MKIKTWGLLLICFMACKDKYIPDIHLPSSGFLVVEGFINAGKGPTTISLSRTVALDSTAILSESGAQVEVQSESGASYALTGQAGGKYIIDQVPIDSGLKYRLHIKTSNGKDYLSDLSAVKISPPIDSVNWKAQPDFLSIYVSTHDTRNLSLYYQWSFEETWQYHSAYPSKLEYNPKDCTIVDRPDIDVIYSCWKMNQSTEIFLATTTSLSSDIVYQYPLLNISYYSSNRLVSRYSILVKQMVLNKDWYEWKQRLRKNTEQLGSIFDAQPSETGGNIHNTTDPLEQVIGFVGCSSISEKRIFIDRTEIPNVHVYSGYELCQVDTVANSKLPLLYYFGTGYGIPTEPYQHGSIILGSSGGCVDCRNLGGATVKPDFWR